MCFVLLRHLCDCASVLCGTVYAWVCGRRKREGCERLYETDQPKYLLFLVRSKCVAHYVYELGIGLGLVLLQLLLLLLLVVYSTCSV